MKNELSSIFDFDKYWINEIGRVYKRFEDDLIYWQELGKKFPNKFNNLILEGDRQLIFKKIEELNNYLIKNKLYVH